MRYEVLPSMTARAPSSTPDDGAWLPQTLKSKLTKAELAYLERERATIAEQTRAQIARALHDNTLQSLSSVSYRLAALQLSSDKVQPQDVQTLHEEVKAAIVQLRSDISSLGNDENVSLHEKLESHITKLKRHGLVPTIHQSLEPATKKLARPLQGCVVSVLREGLANCLKHARANHVWLEVFFQKHHLIVNIADDGKGITTSHLWRVAKRKPSGLTALADQVAGFNGRVFLRSRQGKGTVLASLIPLAENGS